MKRVNCLLVPGFLLIELLTACATSLVCITMLVKWQGILIERKKNALHTLKLIAYTQSKLDQLSVDDILKSKVRDEHGGIRGEWSIQSIPLTALDGTLSKAAIQHHFSYIKLNTQYQNNPAIKTLYAYKALA